MGRTTKKKHRKRTVTNDDEMRISRLCGSDFIYILLIAGLVILFFLPATVFGHVFFAGDVMNVYNPYQAINAEQLAEGKMPLWTDRFFCGFPLFAESQGALFYPPTRLAYFLSPVHHAFTLDALFHFFLAGLFMYILARYLGQRPLAAFLAASAFAFSGLFASLIINFTIFRSAVWIPIIFYLTRRVLLERGLRWTLLLSLSIVCQMMGGSLQITAISIMLMFIDVIYVIITSLAKKAFLISTVRVLKVVLGVGLAVGLYAFQLWPTWELTNLAQRGIEASYDMAASYSFPPQHLIDIAMPNYLGDPNKFNLMPGIPPAPNYFGYIGVIALGLALYAFSSKKAGIFWPISILFVVLSLGPAGKLFNIVYWVVPFFDKFRAPDRFLIVFVFGVALLAGFGANKILAKDEEEEESPRRKKKNRIYDEDEPTPRRRHLLILGILMLIAIIGILPWLGSPGKVMFDGIMSVTLAGPLGVTIDVTNFAQYEVWRDGVPLTILYFVAFASAIPLFNLLFGRAAGGRGLVLLFLILNCIDLFAMTSANHNSRMVDGKFFAEDPKSVQFIKSEDPYARVYAFGKENYLLSISGMSQHIGESGLSDLHREYVRLWYQGAGGTESEYFSLREIVTPNLSAYYGLYDAGGFASLYTEDFYLFEGVVINQLRYITAGNNISSHLNNGRPRHLLLDTMAAKYIITSVPFPEGGRFVKVFDDEVMIYRNTMAFPRAYVAHPSSIVELDNSNLEELARIASQIGGFDFEGSIILSPGAGATVVPDDRAGISRDIEPTIVEPGRIRATVNIDSPGIFVLADSYYPGWVATVDGEEKPIHRANLYYRGVVLDTIGTHEIEFIYAPKSFNNGKLFSLLAFVLFILLALGKGLIDRWFRSPEDEEEETGMVKVIRHGLFGKKVYYEEEDDEYDDDDYE